VTGILIRDKWRIPSVVVGGQVDRIFIATDGHKSLGKRCAREEAVGGSVGRRETAVVAGVRAHRVVQRKGDVLWETAL